MFVGYIILEDETRDEVNAKLEMWRKAKKFKSV